MTTSRRTLRFRKGDDSGSAIAFLPILGLTAIAGSAALVGIALQPDASEAAEPAPITAAQLGRPCTEQAGAFPAGAQARTDWLTSVANCIDARVEGALGASAASTNSGYGGVVVTSTFAGEPAIIVRWTETPPTVVVRWAALHPNGVVVVASPSGS